MNSSIKNKFAAQLFTLRNELEHDFPGTLRALKEMGWPAVQISGLRNHTKEQIVAALQETGLKTAGMHVPLDRLRDDLPEVLAEAQLFGTKDLICPYLSDDLRHEAGYRAVRSELNTIANKLADEGYRISYHNHDFELQVQVDGTTALAYMLEPSDSNAVLTEVDVYWVKKAGLDPLTFIQPFANRMPIIHLKDMSHDERQFYAEIGTGTIDFAPILSWGEHNGIEWYAVEQDECPGNPMDSLQLSLNNLNKLVDEAGL
jgi:sugar phosphate isomerase/epimerase